MANFGTVGVDWQQRVNWDRLRKYRLERARERMKAHNLGALLLMYDENVRYVTSTLTPGWNRLKPGLRYALLCGDGPPVLFEQGDIGFQIQRHAPWIPAENIRWSYAWIKGAAGPASKQQVKKFTDAIVKEMRRYDVADKTLGVDFIDINMLNQFNEAKQVGRRRSEEHTSELQSQSNIVCRLLLEKKKTFISRLMPPLTFVRLLR